MAVEADSQLYDLFFRKKLFLFPAVYHSALSAFYTFHLLVFSPLHQICTLTIPKFLNIGIKVVKDASWSQVINTVLLNPKAESKMGTSEMKQRAWGLSHRIRDI